MVFQERLYTAEEFYEFVNRPENKDKWYELYRGVIYEAIMPSPIHAIISLLIAKVISDFVTKYNLGHVVGDGCHFYLPNGDTFIPDTAFVSKERQPTIPPKFELAPDLAVEIVSPSNRPHEILDKVESYIECGTKLVWVVYPDDKVVDVWSPVEGGGQRKRKLDINGVLDGEDVLPGFKLPVRQIFEQQS